MAKMSVTFDGFADMAERLDRMGGDLRKAANEALEATQDVTAQNLATAAAPYAHKGGGLKGYATGAMYRTIERDNRIAWGGSVATVDAGFDLKADGGFHSIFVMYGTPRMSKDVRVYNAIKGARTRADIAKRQKEIMQRYLAIGGK